MRALTCTVRPVFTLTHLAAFCVVLLVAAELRSQEVLIPADGFWRYFKGTEAPPADWNTLDFDDTLWEEGQAGFGYGDNDDSTILTDMMGSYVSAFIRSKFDVRDLNQIQVLQLGMKWDDGFVAYLNGTEIARANITGAVGTPPAFNAFATDHEVNATEMFFTVGANEFAALKQGMNVLAIEGHNGTLDSSDFSLIPQLRYYPSACPTAVTCTQQANGAVRLTWTVVVSPPPFDTVEIARNGTVIGMPTTPATRTFTDAAPTAGENVYQVVATVRGTRCSGNGVPSCTITVAGPAEQFRRGDADRDRQINLTDPLFVLNYLFQNGPAPGCPDAADADDNGQLQLTDGLYILNFLFANGSAMPPPGPTTCGPDATTTDSLGSCTYTTC